MPDEADIANAMIEREEALWSKALRYDIPEGIAGECDLCGEPSPRLIEGACAACRDKYKLK
jgi:hypothetical protein